METLPPAAAEAADAAARQDRGVPGEVKFGAGHQRVSGLHRPAGAGLVERELGLPQRDASRLSA